MRIEISETSSNLMLPACRVKGGGVACSAQCGHSKGHTVPCMPHYTNTRARTSWQFCTFLVQNNMDLDDESSVSGDDHDNVSFYEDEEVNPHEGYDLFAISHGDEAPLSHYYDTVTPTYPAHVHDTRWKTQQQRDLEAQQFAQTGQGLPFEFPTYQAGDSLVSDQPSGSLKVPLHVLGQAVSNNVNVNNDGEQINQTLTPLQCFQLFFTESHLQSLRIHTNTSLHHWGFVHQKDVVSAVSKEFKAWLGLLLMMGIVKRRRVSLFWGTHWSVDNPGWREVMTCSRWSQLWRRLKLYFPPQGQHAQGTNDKLKYVRVLMEDIRMACRLYWKPPLYCSFDEMSIGCKNTRVAAGLKRYNPHKPHKFLIMVFGFTSSNGKYVLNFHIPLGKERQTLTHEVPHGHLMLSKCSQPMLRVLKPYAGLGLRIAVDNFYMTLEMIQECLIHNTYVFGTVRKSRSKLPFYMKSKGMTPDCDKYEDYCLSPNAPPIDPSKLLLRGNFEWRLKGQITALAWQDKKPVTCLSSFHNPMDFSGQVSRVLRPEVPGIHNDGQMIIVDEVQRSNVAAPKVMLEYNNHMGGNDIFDQRRQHHSTCETMRVRKWWKQVFLFLLDVCLTNAWSVYNEIHRLKAIENGDQHSEKSYADFVTTLCDELTQDWRMQRQVDALGKRRGRPPTRVHPENSQFRLACNGHHPIAQRSPTRCEYCWLKSGRTLKRTSSYIGAKLAMLLCILRGKIVILMKKSHASSYITQRA
jgi:hypothetical protein